MSAGTYSVRRIGVWGGIAENVLGFGVLIYLLLQILGGAGTLIDIYMQIGLTRDLVLGGIGALVVAAMLLGVLCLFALHVPRQPCLRYRRAVRLEDGRLVFLGGGERRLEVELDSVNKADLRDAHSLTLWCGERPTIIRSLQVRGFREFREELEKEIAAAGEQRREGRDEER